MATSGTERRRPRRKRRPVTDDPALHERHAAALQLLRKGLESDGPLLLSYVVWPSPGSGRTSD